MTDSKRSIRQNASPQAVNACLHVAITNTVLLTSRAEGEDLASNDLSFVANTVRQAIIVALQQASRLVDRLVDITSPETGERLTTTGEFDKVEAVWIIGRELAALAGRAALQTITFAEFEDIYGRLTALGFALKPHHALDVASAVADQKAP